MINSKAHGEVFVKLVENIIFVKLNGAFNEFGAKNYTKAVKEKVINLNGKSFSILINNIEMLGGTPEAYEELEKHNAWLNQQNLIAKAMVITSSTAVDIMDSLSPSRKIQKNRNFDNEKDALRWLKKLSNEASVKNNKQLK